MEIIMIEARTFETMMAGFEALTAKMERFCQENDDKRVRQWLDIQEVCDLLKVSKRTLQTYRDQGILPASRIGHKTYYFSQDVERVISNLKQPSNESGDRR